MKSDALSIENGTFSNVGLEANFDSDICMRSSNNPKRLSRSKYIMVQLVLKCCDRAVYRQGEPQLSRCSVKDKKLNI